MPMPPEGFVSIGATPYLSPVPAVLVGCADPERDILPNLITIAWAGVVCSKPPMIGISIRPERYSYDIIRRTREFTVNLATAELCKALDFCGVKSGREVDKFAACGLTPIKAEPLSCAPAVAQSPAHLCCAVKDILPLGSHDLFLAQVLAVNVGEDYFAADGSIDEGKMQLVGYVHGRYRQLGRELGFFGYSIASPEALRRRMTPEMLESNLMLSNMKKGDEEDEV